MASDGCDPPIPPSAISEKEKGKKKSYMVKLLNRFNNVNASSSQPSTPTSTSTARFVPPPLQVPGLTPTPPPIPPSLEVPPLTPSSQQFAADQWRSPSPHVGSNPTTPTNMPSPSPIGDNPPRSSSAANDFEDVSNNRPIITPIGGGFYPTKTASKAITATIKAQFDEPWVTWGQIPQTRRDVFFERFRRKVSWRSNHEEKVKKNFHTKASHRLSEMFKKARTEGKKPDWMGDIVWNGLLEKWNMPVYRQKCETAKKNRTSDKGGCLHTGGSISVHEHAIRLSQELGRSVHVDEIFQQTHIRASTGEFVDERTSDKGGCLHTGGSISVHEHAIRLSQELGRSVHVDEIFQQTHIRASTGEFVDERSRRTHEEFEARFSQIRSETASVGASTCAPLDPADEERLRNQCWLDVAGGRYKGRVYGIGNVSAPDDCVDSYIQQTQASSSQQPIAEDILNLHTRVSTHDDQLRQMNSQLQGFIGVMMQYLPPPAAAIAQQFLQSQNQPQANVQPQQPQQPTDQPQQPTNQPQDDTVYGDY
ncbi:hypothetical protein LR48_Vigan09g013300 [Vigna angularis]|uniref:Transposase, Ptta/En/Spm, plant n=1 Tax=Phaseolus angularis TaxID=3914 RepID=A0A0L9VA23_PHAAN|nr:hypothetical protein LR48_Vigan09g013300 [Vigna angularis]